MMLMFELNLSTAKTHQNKTKPKKTKHKIFMQPNARPNLIDYLILVQINICTIQIVKINVQTFHC